jgi:gamma-glutamyltranspeptidase/glutathione hydrolase
MAELENSAFRFAPGRGPATAASAMVASSQSAATLAGLEILRRGGNAVDAAIAAAAVLCVAEPMSTGVGGDVFALIWDGAEVHGLDAAGPAPASAAPLPVPTLGSDSVTVPGAVAGWAELSRRFGRFGLDTCLERAADLAQSGVAAGFHCSLAWRRAQQAPEEFGRPPRTGEIFRLPDLASTLRMIAEGGPDVFYRGAIAEAIVACSWLEAEDLARYEATWTSPMTAEYRGVRVVEMPPPTQGVAALEGLRLLESMAPSLANQVRAVALALEDALERVRDDADVADLLDEAWIARRRGGSVRLLGEPAAGTVYLCCLDADGMAVSLIQSLYQPFGSGVVAPGTGIVLQNRAACFHVGGAVEAGRRPYHTIIPGMLLEDGRLRGPFGVVGTFIQAQAHVQLVSALVDKGLDPQAALDQPRFRIGRDVLCVEEGLWSAADALRREGYARIEHGHWPRFGVGQVIQVHDDRILGGSDARGDGVAAGI